MSDGIKLRTHRLVDRRYAMAVNITPQRRNAIEILVAILIDEETAVRPLNDERSLRRIGLHGCEGMPDVLAVPLLELITGWHGKQFTDYASPRNAALTGLRRTV